MTILAGTAAWERAVMLERQLEGIAKAKAAGRYRGRAPTARPSVRTRQGTARRGGEGRRDRQAGRDQPGKRLSLPELRCHVGPSSDREFCDTVRTEIPDDLDRAAGLSETSDCGTLEPLRIVAPKPQRTSCQTAFSVA